MMEKAKKQRGSIVEKGLYIINRKETLVRKLFEQIIIANGKM